jgi:hypothetical protein
MRATALFAGLGVCLALVGCVTENELQTSTTTSAISEANTSVNWDPEVGCGPVKNPDLVPCDGNFLWPADAGITSVQVLLRKGPQGTAGPTFLAFVVWNDSVVGRILRAPTAGRAGTHLRASINNIIAGRTTGAPDTSAGSSGNVSGGKSPPVPGPHIDDAIQFSPGYLTAAKNAARAIHLANAGFLDYAE